LVCSTFVGEVEEGGGNAWSLFGDNKPLLVIFQPLIQIVMLDASAK